jgi:hypothetical protein
MKHKHIMILGTVIGLATGILALWLLGVDRLALIHSQGCSVNASALQKLYQQLSIFPALAAIVTISVVATSAAFYLAKKFKESLADSRLRKPLPEPFMLLPNASRLDRIWLINLIEHIRIFELGEVGSFLSAMLFGLTAQLTQSSYIKGLDCVNPGNIVYYQGSAMIVSSIIAVAAFFAHHIFVRVFKPQARLKALVDHMVDDAVANSRVTMHNRWSDHVVLWNKAFGRNSNCVDHARSRFQDAVVAALRHKRIVIRRDSDGRLLWHPSSMPWNMKHETIDTSHLNVDVQIQQLGMGDGSINLCVGLVHKDGPVISVTTYLHSHINKMEISLYPQHCLVGGGTSLPWVYRDFNSDASAASIIRAVATISAEMINAHLDSISVV